MRIWPFVKKSIFGDGGTLGTFRTLSNVSLPVDFPQDIPAAGMMSSAERLQFRKAPWEAGVEPEYSMDVDCGINWGLVLQADTESQFSMDVDCAIDWGLVLEASPESRYSMDVDCGIAWNYLEVAEPESQYSMDVDCEIRLMTCYCSELFTYTLDSLATGCGSPDCTGSPSGTLVYAGNISGVCHWDVGMGSGICSWQLRVSIDGTAVLDGLMIPASRLDWQGSCGSFDCGGTSVFTKTGGACTGPATITVTKV